VCGSGGRDRILQILAMAPASSRLGDKDVRLVSSGRAWGPRRRVYRGGLVGVMPYEVRWLGALWPKALRRVDHHAAKQTSVMAAVGGEQSLLPDSGSM
jgi:hypothetical protein